MAANAEQEILDRREQILDEKLNPISTYSVDVCMNMDTYHTTVDCWVYK